MAITDTDNVPLKEHFEKLYDAKLDAIALALRLQAAETERRLEMLNNSQDRADKFAAKVLTVEQYTTKHELLASRIVTLEENEIKRNERELANRETMGIVKAVMTALVIATVLALAGIGWEILTHGIALVKP